METYLVILSPLSSNEPPVVKEEDLQAIADLAKSHGLFCFIYWRLSEWNKEQNVGSCVTDFLARHKLLYMANAARSIQAEIAETGILAKLRDKKIPVVEFRGNGLAKKLYGTPNCRSSVDVDLLIRQEDVSQIDSLLNGIGYTTESERPLAYDLGRIHHATYYQKEKDIPIEVHWNFGVPYFFNVSSKQIWDGILETEKFHFELSPEMLVVMLLIHHHSHSFLESRILVDLLWSLNKYNDTVDWNEFVKQLKKIGLIKTTRIVLDQLVDLWGDQVREMKGFEVLDQAITESGIKVPRFLRTYFVMEIKRTEPHNLYKDKFLARLILDKWSTIIGSYFKTLFPPPEAIKALYEDERMWMLPINYMRFIWWRVGEWVKR